MYSLTANSCQPEAMFQQGNLGDDINSFVNLSILISVDTCIIHKAPCDAIPPQENDWTDEDVLTGHAPGLGDSILRSNWNVDPSLATLYA